MSGGFGTDALSIVGPLTTGALTVSDITPDDVELSGLVTTTGDQQYLVPVTLVANTTVDAGAGNITFASTVTGAFTLDANSTATTTFGDDVNVAALTTNLVGTTAINGDVVTTTGNQTYNDAVTLNSAVNVTTLTTTGDVRFGGTLDSQLANEELLTVNAVNVEFIGDIGSTATGALSTLDVNATGNVSIAAARIINNADLEATTGQIIDLNGIANNVTANNLFATAANGISLDTTINNLLASNTTANGVDINELDNVMVLLVAAPGLQTVTLTAGGAILDGNLPGVNNITALSLIANATTGIELDTTIVNLVANNTTSNGIIIRETDDLNVGAVVAVNQAVTLTAGGQINNTNGPLVDVTAGSLDATSVNGILLDTTIGTLTASNSTLNGIDINESDDLSVITVAAPGQTVTLSAGGAITDGNLLTSNVTATTLDLTAVNGISLDTTIDNLTATNSTANGIDISETDNLNVITVTATNQTVTLLAGGEISDGNLAVSNVSALTLIATAATGINLDTTIDSISASNTTSGGIDINETDDLEVLGITAPGQAVNLTAGGAITDGNLAAPNILSLALVANAVNGIMLGTTIDDLTATNTTTGGITITETDDLNILLASAPGQTVSIAAGGDLHVTTVNAGSAILNAGDVIDDVNVGVAVTATSLTATAVNGITLDTTIADLTATNSVSNGITITETNDLNVLLASAPAQPVSILAAGSLNVTTVSAGPVVLNAGNSIAGVGAGVNVTGTSLNAIAVNGITLDTSVDSLTASNTTAGGIDIDEVNSVSVNTLTALNQTVLLSAGGAITDGNGGTPNVLGMALNADAVNGITLGTTIINLTATNTTSNGIAITETDDLNILLASAPAQTVSILAGGTLNVTTVNAGPVVLNAGNMIADVLAGVNVTGTSLNATAVNGIILDTAIDTLTASNTTTGGIDIGELNSMNVMTASAPGQTVTLDAGGTIGDGNGNPVNIISASLVISAVTGISLDTTITNLLASNTTSGGVDINETDDLSVFTVTASAQPVILNAGGEIDDGNAGLVNITSASLTAGAATGIFLDTTIADLTATNSTSNGIDINETDNLNVLLASALGQAVNLQTGGSQNVTIVNAGTATMIAAGAITDANGVAVNVSASSLNTLANNGIALGTAVANLTTTNNTSGDILINEADGLTLQSAINNAAAIQVVSAFGPLNIVNVKAKAHFLGSTDDSAAPGDDVVVSGNVEADNAVSLVAGDNSTLQGASNIKSNNSFVYLKVGGVTADAIGGQLVTYAAVQGSAALQYPIVAEGGNGNDLFSLQKIPISPIAILGRGGSLDNTFVVFSNAAEQINAFATVVDIAGQAGTEITYVDNEQLDLNTLDGNDNVFVQMPEPTHGVLANIIRTSTGAGDDSLKVNGSTQNDVMRAASYTGDANYRFQVRGDTGETEVLQMFGFTGNDTLENQAPIGALLDGGSGNDTITGANFAGLAYDVIFGGGELDTILGNDGNDFLFADHDFNAGVPVQTFANGDQINSGRGFDVIVALGGDSVRRQGGDFDSDLIIGQNVGLSINDFLFAQILPPSSANINAQLQAALAKKAAKPIP
jgi:hypothetical protein